MSEDNASRDRRVSYKAFDSEAMEAARRAASAAGVSIEEWLSRTILQNARRGGLLPPDAEQVSADFANPRRSRAASEQMAAITKHLGEAQRAADAAGIPVGEWLTRKILENAPSSHETARRSPGPGRMPGGTQERQPHDDAGQGRAYRTPRPDDGIRGDDDAGDETRLARIVSEARRAQDRPAAEPDLLSGLPPHPEPRLAARRQAGGSQGAGRRDRPTDSGPLMLRNAVIEPRPKERRARRRGLSLFSRTLLVLLCVIAAVIWLLPHLPPPGDLDFGAGTTPVPREATAPDGSGDGGRRVETLPLDAEKAALAAVARDRMPVPAAEHVDWYRKAADAGNPGAQYVLATLYIAGGGVDRDMAEAARWLRRAAVEHGYADAQYALGVLYRRGLGVEGSDVEAALWFQRAADQGQVQALTQVGIDYLQGVGVTRDLGRARLYLERAGAAGEPNAQYALGGMYERGDGVEEDRITALKWFILAAERKHRYAPVRVEDLTQSLSQEERDRATELAREHNRRYPAR